jgi:hypothetical protein
MAKKDMNNTQSTQPDDALEAREAEAGEQPEFDEGKSAPSDRAERGPYDASEVPSMRPYIDMGGMKIAPREGLKVRLDVDQKSNRIMAISMDYQNSTLQVQAFSAPKSTGLWNETRTQLKNSLSQQNAQITERDGQLGPELLVEPGKGAEGQTVRFIGVDGPRWMIRGVIVGEAALGGESAAGIESVFREVVVVRGEAPMPPSELLPLKVPAGLQRSSETEDSTAAAQAQDSADE